VNYFRDHLRVGDYLSEAGKVEMEWFGEGACRLGLSGPCDMAALERLCAGQHPGTGEKLSVRDKGAARRVCFFGQISAPKDVSIALLVGGDRRIEEWWKEAVAETMREMEAVTATRVRAGGRNEDRTTGNMVAAFVTHDTSRALDPQLHTHVCVLNFTFDPVEKRWKGVQPYGYMRHQGFLREVCYNRLAARMQAGGYELERQSAIGFTIKGFPSELREKFSQRRQRILEIAAEKGRSSQDDLQTIALESRPAKRHTTAAELQTGWRASAGAHLATIEAVIEATRHKPVAPTVKTAAEALAAAEAHIFERKSVVATRDLFREALVWGRGTVDLSALRTELDAHVASGELRMAGDEVASRDGAKAEEEFIAWAAAGKTSCGYLGRHPTESSLDEDQREAVAGVLASRSRVTVLAGDAGTGKTRSLREIVAGIEQSGGRVFGCAPSSGAADVLRRELSAEADTLQQLLVNEALQREVRGRVLVVDEAGLVSVKQMRDLCRLAHANDHRVLLVGDTKQHSSVEAGDALRCLQKFADVPVFRLTQIRRQRSPQYREAVALLAKGEAFGAFNRFVKLGAVREDSDQAGLMRAAAADYVATLRSGKSCLAISPVWDEIHAFNAEARRQLRAAGMVADHERRVPVMFSLHWTKAQMRDTGSFQPGQVLLFHRSSGYFPKGECLTVVARDPDVLTVQFEDGGRTLLSPRRTSGFDVGLMHELDVSVGDRLLLRGNLKAEGLRNGDLVEVAGFSDAGGIRLKDGREIPPSFRQFTHGYATTSHAAQGKTVDRGLLIMGEAGIAAGNLKQAYVSNSRFRDSQVIYTTDRRAAREAMMSDGDRKLATEMAAQVEASPAAEMGGRVASRASRGVSL
jgi:conjugative relaxase-like TrwC/TraI family protein